MSKPEMIRVERGAEVGPGVFAWHVPALGLSGRSRQPLLDACRQINSLLEPPKSVQRYSSREGPIGTFAARSIGARTILFRSQVLGASTSRSINRSSTAIQALR